MTQRDSVLSYLMRESDGLTSIELAKLTGIPKHSLRTIVWELRRDGLIDVVAGVRGKWRYGLTDEGREVAPAPPGDYIEQKVRSGMLGAFGDLGAFWRLPDVAATERRRLTSFARWVVIEHPELFAKEPRDARAELENAIADYVSESFESMGFASLFPGVTDLTGR